MKISIPVLHLLQKRTTFEQIFFREVCVGIDDGETVIDYVGVLDGLCLPAGLSKAICFLIFSNPSVQFRIILLNLDIGKFYHQIRDLICCLAVGL